MRIFAAILCREAVTEGLFGLSCVGLSGLVFFFSGGGGGRRETVSTPFPRQLESSGLNREYSAFVSCLEGIPGMQEVSSVLGLASLWCHFISFPVEN